MNKTTPKTNSAPKAAAANIDRRLQSFFSDSEENEAGPIYEELSNGGDRYSDFHKIATGGMKDIFSVLDTKGDRRLAMALLHEDKGAEDYETFLREARLTAQLDHPNIIKIHDIGLNQDKRPYFTMDLKSGRTLKKALNNSHKLHDSLVIFFKVCDAVSYAHSKGVIHLDLKPENIQIGEYGEVLVCDWGLGKIIDDESFTDDHTTGSYILNDVTLHGLIKGTPGFMAPEQINGDPKTKSTDIFSLGAILYNILTGIPPYTGDVEDILKKTTDSQPDLPSKASKNKIPESLEAVVMKAMAIESEDRYESVAKISKEVRSYLAGFATEAENAGVIKTLGLVIKRNKALFSVSSLAIVVLIISVVFFIDKIQQEKSVALEERDRANRLSESELSARKEAEKNAELLKAEKEELKELNKAYAEDLTLQSIFFSENINHWDFDDEKIYHQALDNLQKATKMGSDNHLAWAHKAILLFIMQRYKEANEAFKRSQNLSIIETALETTLSLEFYEIISAEDLAKLIENVNKVNINRGQRKSLIDKMITYDQISNKRTVEEKVILTEALIKVWNTGWQGTIEFDPRESHLSLAGKGLSTLRTTKNHLTIKHNILRLLNPKSITFTETSFRDLFHIQDLEPLSLDLRGTIITGFKILKEFKILKHLTVTEIQYKKIKKLNLDGVNIEIKN